MLPDALLKTLTFDATKWVKHLTMKGPKKLHIQRILRSFQACKHFQSFNVLTFFTCQPEVSFL